MWRALILIFLGLLLLTGLLYWAFPEVNLSREDSVQFVSLALISTYLLLALFQGRLAWGEAGRYAFIWVGVGLVLVIGYSFRHELSDLKGRLTSSLYPTEGRVGPAGEVQFSATLDGHFYVSALVNNVKMRFLVDTGASRVVLNQYDAKRLGISTDQLSYGTPTSTANGMVFSSDMTIDSIIIEGHELNNIPASVSNSDLTTSLLGMSYLERLKGYKVEKGELTLLF